MQVQPFHTEKKQKKQIKKKKRLIQNKKNEKNNGNNNTQLNLQKRKKMSYNKKLNLEERHFKFYLN